MMNPLREPDRRGQWSYAMNQRNILPYDGHAYLIDDTSGAFDWPKITACLAETMPWRIETARLFGREMPVPRMSTWFGEADYTYSGIRHRAVPFPRIVQRLREWAAARMGRKHLRRIIQRGFAQSLSERR